MSNTPTSKTSIYVDLTKENQSTIRMVHLDDASPIIKVGLSGVKDGKITGTGTFPPTRANDTIESVESRIRNAVIHGTYFSSKLVGVCELSGEKYHEYDEGLICKRFRGSIGIVDDPYGCLVYHSKYEDLMELSNIYFETHNNLLTSTSLSQPPNNTGYLSRLKINVMRSSGILDEDVYIQYSMPLRYLLAKPNRPENLGISVNLMLSDGQPGTKYVLISQIKKHNPELFPIDIIIYQNIPEWLQEERKKWYNLMIGILIKEIGENSINIIHKN